MTSGGCDMVRLLVLAVSSCLLLFSSSVESFYLPGVPRNTFEDDSEMAIDVMKLTSTENMLPYDFYSLPFCQEDADAVASNLGEVLAGTRKKNSPYETFFKRNTFCKVLCTKKYDNDDSELFTKRIEQKYRAHMVLDNLPAARPVFVVDAEGKEETFYELGYSVGFEGNLGKGETYINNHLYMKILFHREETESGVVEEVIVGFEVSPYSISHVRNPNPSPDNKSAVPLLTCSPDGTMDSTAGPQRIDTTGEVIWTYDVVYEESEVKWAQRWSRYLQMSGSSQIHWFSIMTSVVIALVLTGMVAMILLRTLHADVARYRELLDDPEEKAMEETGWKLIHGDVFRPPRHPLLFSVMMGSGAQILAICAIVLVFAVLGFLSPAIRGGLLTTTIILFEFMSALAGYVTSRVYKQFACTDWKKATISVALAFPGISFLIFFIVDMAVWAEKSSAAVPFSTMFLLMFLWFFISVPLVFLGAYLGFKAPVVEVGETNHFPRLIPEQPWFLRGAVVSLMAGVLPFGAVFIELNFVLKSLWTNEFYYLFGILFVVFLILLATCAEVSVVMVYFQLSAEDYNWWWRSVLCSGASAVYIFLYGVYFFTQLGVTRFVPGLVYFSYTLLTCMAFFLLTGCIGYIASWKFVRSIYKSIRSD